MLHLITGNILSSNADCLVNTVNCEGFMGKGLAYQFKNQFPETNKSYMEACKQNLLHPGKLHYHIENGKFIVNFPTKDKWRENSKLEYIENGMKSLIELINSENIKSIAIPPLGSGNGGLQWEEVKNIILTNINPLIKNIDITIYEPSLSYKAIIKQVPKLNMSHLILMHIKNNLQKFSKFRLQKTAFFLNVFSHNNYFKFEPHIYGPYSHSLEILSRDIKEFQEYHKFKTDKALEFAKQTLLSQKVEKELKNFIPSIQKATSFINTISSNEELELISTICFIVYEYHSLDNNSIIEKIHAWSELKKEKFSDKQITDSLQKLAEQDIINQNIFGLYSLK